jgi:hypothetical protein
MTRRENSEGKPLNIQDGRQSPGFLPIDSRRVSLDYIYQREVSVAPVVRWRSLNWGLIAALFISFAFWIILFGLA